IQIIRHLNPWLVAPIGFLPFAHLISPVLAFTNSKAIPVFAETGHPEITRMHGALEKQPYLL
ncbi:MAG: hypothetical protein PVJ96_06535, partial [Paracoccaceae bacterium]